jgi:hypothetical protein
MAFVVLGSLFSPQAKADPPCRLQVQAALPLGFASGLATIETKIDGVSETFGLDTGAITLVTPEAVKSLRLPRDWRRTRTVGTTAVMIANNYIVEDFEFAGRHYRGKSVPAVALHDDKKGGAPPMGLIGTDILAGFDLDFDYPNRKLTVYKASGCKMAMPPDFTAASSISFKFNGQRGPVFPADLDGKKLRVILDTGASALAITRAAAIRLNVTDLTINTDLAVNATGAGDVTKRQPFHQFTSLSFGSETIPEPLFSIVDAPITTGDILLGQKFLFSRRFFLSNSTRTLFFGKGPVQMFKYTPSTVTRLPGTK